MQTRQLRRAAERQTAKQACSDAKRATSQPATAPATPEPKPAGTPDPFSYAIYSRHFVIRNEDPAELAALKADLRADHQPANTTEEILINEMAEQFWRIRRFRTRETCYMLLEDPEPAAVAELKMIPMIQRLMSAAERGFHKALTTLRQLQKDRGFVPQSSENTQDKEKIAAAAAPGFVPQMAQPKPPDFDNNADLLEYHREQILLLTQINADLDSFEEEMQAKSV